MLTILPLEPANPHHVEGLVALFDASSCPCYCRYWHFSGDKNAWLERCYVNAGRNEAELRQAIAAHSDEASGLVACSGEKLLGWIKIAPSRSMRKFYEQRYYRGLPVLQGRPAEGVFAVGCLLVHPEHRGRRVAHALIHESVSFAKLRGAAVLEAFPRRTEGRVSDEEHWMGPEPAFLAAGFTAVSPEGPYPVYRREL
ncbi:MAG: GNAT family N-acetyltransferase [Myxococcales bacterium]|nr:GNAT family N-acetyltransferase [Polyangiaceae bacterium]MDW8249871.1 GNAT family N-acetyltransferase [Myxococcales bacterium]